MVLGKKPGKTLALSMAVVSATMVGFAAGQIGMGSASAIGVSGKVTYTCDIGPANDQFVVNMTETISSAVPQVSNRTEMLWLGHVYSDYLFDSSIYGVLFQFTAPTNPASVEGTGTQAVPWSGADALPGAKISNTLDNAPFRNDTSQPLDVQGLASVHWGNFPTAGNETISIGQINLSLTLRDASGNVIGNSVPATCTPNSGQNTTLATIVLK